MFIFQAMLYALLTFVSPCVLPMLTVYIAYVSAGEKGKWKTIFNIIGFCAAIAVFFMAVSVSLALTAKTFQDSIEKYQDLIYSIAGVLLILFGLKFMGYLNLPFLNKSVNINVKTENVNFLNAFLLGIVFSLSMGMCGLGYIVTLFSDILANPNLGKGILIGAVFTATLVVLFAACAILIDKLKGVLKFLQKHYKVINFVAGGILIVMGIIMVLGFMDEFTALLS